MGMLLVPFFDVIALIVDLYFKVVVVEVVIFWLLHFKIISVNNKYATKFMDILKKGQIAYSIFDRNRLELERRNAQLE